MDPNALIASLQQSGAQFTPAQIQQIQNQFQQQQNPQNEAASDPHTGNNLPQPSIPNHPNNGIHFLPTMTAPQQTSLAPGSTTNQPANAAYPFALFGASPLQQQLAALSGFPQAQQQPNSNDLNALQPKPQPPNAIPNLQVQQPQQMATWNPQQLQMQPQQFANPFLPALMPMQLQQQLQQQFLAQQMLQLGAGGGNAVAANHLLAALLASQQQQQQPAPPCVAAFPTAPPPTDATKGPSDGKINGEVEWTKPFAGKVKKESPFPLKLYQILSNPECQECICWNPHGRSWRILKPPVFEQVVIPLYFRHAKYASFMRQVNGWGFKRVVTGSDHNSYYHEYFVRDNPQLCLQMKRIKKKDGESFGGRKDEEGSEDDEGASNEPLQVGGNESKRLDNTAIVPALPAAPTQLPTPTPNDIMQFAGMAGLNTAMVPTAAATAQPNFLMNGMLPAALLAANPQAALLNGLNPFVMPTGSFPAAMPNMPTAEGVVTTIPGMPMGNPPVAPAPQPANLPVNGTAASQVPSQMVNNLTNALSGMDSETLAKLQEIVNSGGAESLLQHIQQQQQQGGNTAVKTDATKVEEEPNAGDDDTEEDKDGDTFEA